MTALLDRVLIPVASESDARTTAAAAREYLDEDTEVVAVTVVEKAGGAPDKASVEQRELEAEDAFDVLRAELGDVETEIRYGTDVAEAIFEAAADHDATSIAFTSRGGGRLARLLSGDVAIDLVTEADRPVVALPGPETVPDDSGGDST